MTASQNAQVTTSQDAEVVASKFIVSQMGKFRRSKTRLYMALIVDVLHNHGAIMPRGYPASVCATAPDVPADLIAKYCTLIRPALQSAHAATLATFTPTEAGLDAAVAWLENQAKLGGYSMSLEDNKRFFQGKWSIRGQKEQEMADAETRRAATLSAEASRNAAQEADAASVAEARAEQGAADATEKDAKVSASNAARKAVQATLEKVVAMPVRPTAGEVEHGDAVIGEQGQTHVFYIQDKGETVTLSGLDNIPLDTLTAAFDAFSTYIAERMAREGVEYETRKAA